MSGALALAAAAAARREICTLQYKKSKVAPVSANTNGPWAVLTADVVASAKVTDLENVRDRVLSELSDRHLNADLVRSRYSVTAWDEFQNVLAQPSALADVVWDLRLAFRPRIDLKIGIGLGAIDKIPGPRTPLNKEASGEGFLLARDAVDHLQKAREKYPLRTYVRSTDQQLERTLNLVYMLTDSLLSNLSDRQWETIREYRKAGRMELAAQRLEVETSTVSRNLQRGFYWQMETARHEIRELLQAHLHLEVQKA